MRLLYEPLIDIPANFTEVEYLKSDGINLMYITPGLEYFPDFEIGVKCDSNSDRNATLGVDGNNMLERSSASNPYWTLHASGTIFMSNVGVGTYADAKYKDGVFSVNGVTVGTKENTFQSGTLCLFKPHTGNNNLYKMSIYFFKAWDSNGNLVRDLVPCLDNNNVPCMYDKVEGKAYYNQGTGSFTYGRKIIPVEYLQFNGNQYIQTNFNTTDATSFKYEVKFDLSSNITNSEARLISNEGTGAGKYFDIYYVTSNNKLICRPPAAGINLTSEKATIFKYSTTVGKIQGYYEDDPNTLIYDSSATFTAPTIDINYRIGCRGNNTSTQYLWEGKIYYVYLERENLVCDFIPCKDENNVGFMFDRVSHTAYLNAGSGDFVVGKTLPKKKLRLIKESKRRVPKGFKEVEYLESTGTQYINLGYIPTDTTGFKIGQVIPTSNNRDNIIIGCRQATTSDSRFWQDIDWSSSNRTIGWGFGAYSPSGQRYSIVGKAGTYVVTSLNYMNDRAAKVDGVSYDTSLESKTLPEISRPIYLFAGNNGGTEGYYISTKIYFVQITEGNKIVMDLVPCLDNNNVPCMCDKVSGKAYYNVGTGTFSYGHTITPVEYLQSDGTQHIDIPYIPTDTSGLRAVWSYSDDGDRVMAGSRWSSGSSGRWFIGHYSSGLYFGWNSLIATIVTSANTFYDCKLNMYNDKKVYLNGVEEATISTTLDTTNMAAMKLFYVDHAGAKAIGKLKLCQVTEGNKLIYDFIPVKDENNVGYMFDKVNHKLYANSGTGAFTFGNEIKDTTRFLMETKRRLPTGFTEVEYLQSSGTEWIDIGTNVNTATDEIELYFQLTESANYKWIFGQHDDNARLGLGTGDGSNKRNVAYYNNTTKVNNTEMYDSMHQCLVNSNGIYLNGTKIANYASFSSTSTLYLFNLNNSPAVYVCKGKVWAYRQKRNGVLIRDMIPCLDTNNVPCMYDVVNNKAYYNQGTGTFSYGHTITPVEYLQSTGTQYMDSGYNMSDIRKIDMEVNWSAHTDTRREIMGSATSGGYSYEVNATGYYGLGASNYSNIQATGKDLVSWQWAGANTYPKLYINKVLGCTDTLLRTPVGTFRTAISESYATNSKIYWFKIYTDNNVLVRDYIPVKDENNVGYMFDKISHSLYANVGTGSFIIG